MSINPGILSRIERIHAHQQKRWGADHDDQHSANDWIALIANHATGAMFRDVNRDPEYFVYPMLVVAALAINAAESWIRKCEAARG